MTRAKTSFSVHVDDSLDDTFNRLLAAENDDKFRADAKTKIIIHGHLENGRKGWVRDMARAYFVKGSQFDIIKM